MRRQHRTNSRVLPPHSRLKKLIGSDPVGLRPRLWAAIASRLKTGPLTEHSFCTQVRSVLMSLALLGATTTFALKATTEHTESVAGTHESRNVLIDQVRNAGEMKIFKES